LVIFHCQKFADLEVAIFRKCFYSLQVITANKSFSILNETLDSHAECYSSTLVGSSLFMIPSYVKSNDSILGCSNVNDFPINDTVTVSLEQLEASIFVVATFSLWELGVLFICMLEWYICFIGW
jgi:hypothetical protein